MPTQPPRIAVITSSRLLFSGQRGHCVTVSGRDCDGHIVIELSRDALSSGPGEAPTLATVAQLVLQDLEEMVASVREQLEADGLVPPLVLV